MGKVDTSSTRGQGILPGYQSKAVNIDKNGMCEIIVIDQEAQIHPLFQFDCKNWQWNNSEHTAQMWSSQ